MNFGNAITEIPLPKFPAQVLCAQVWRAQKKKKSNYGNVIAEIGKKEKKILVIVAMALPKMGKKIEWNYGNVIAENGTKKKFCCQNLGRNFKKSVTFTIFL